MSNDQRVIDMLTALKADENLSTTLLAAYDSASDASGDGSFARFTQAFTLYMRDAVKPYAKSARSSSSSGEAEWKTEQKAAFSGRGRQWIKVDLDDMDGVLTGFEEEGYDTTEYQSWITNAGFAWVRYSGPRSRGNKMLAAFEVRLEGSRTDSPKTLVTFQHDEIMQITERLPSTPWAMGLEQTTTNNDNDNDNV